MRLRRAVVDDDAVTPEQAIRDAGSGKLMPVYVVVGEEQFLRDRVVRAIVEAADTGVPGFNEDKFIAGDTSAEVVVTAAKTAPMMAPVRLVLVRSVERWDGKAPKGGGSPLDLLAEYVADPMPSSVMVISASKINGSRKLMKAAKKGGFAVSCTPLKRHELPRWVAGHIKAKGHPVSRAVVEAIAELAGPSMSVVVDAVERLSLYVGEGGTIDEEALAAVVTRVRQETVWALVDALAAGDFDKALSALADAYDARDRGLPLLGAVAWRVRQLVKFQSMLGRGCSRAEAAKGAGVPGFKASELERSVRQLPARKLDRWLLLLAEADLALKGSRRSGADVLATMLVEMCA